MDAYKNSTLDCIAITDHNRIDFALQAQKKLGKEKIIVGEEITTAEGEIVGLYLKQVIPAGLTAKETATAVKNQGGLVYIPHPFETVRQGIKMEVLESIKASVDIIEAPNGRSLQSRDATALAWAEKNGVAVAGSSDAHRAKALGRTYTLLQEPIQKESLVTALLNGTTIYKKPRILDLTAPKYNRSIKKITRKT